MSVDLVKLETDLNAFVHRQRFNSSWMFDLITRLPQQDGYKKLPSSIREEVEAIIAAVE